MSAPLGSVPVTVKPTEHYWLWVLCLLGLDYFSTLAYQPSITFAVAGRLGPLATAVVVLLTLFGALPVYCFLAGRAPTGGSSIGMLADLVRGWRGKTLVLVLLGFAATDFTMLKTISLADAAVHFLASDDTGWGQFLHDLVHGLRGLAIEYLSERAAAFFSEQLVATLLLALLGFVFWFMLRRGFNRNVLRLAVPLVVLYLLLNGIILAQGLVHLRDHQELVTGWLDHVRAGAWLIHHPFWVHDGWGSIILLCLLFLPNLALGLSGFEMSMILMPQVRGRAGEEPPKTRIRNTRTVLVVAALIMAVYLLGSSLVTTILIPPEALEPGGPAANRALAYLAHGGTLADAEQTALPWCGPWFGTAYDVVTVLILTLAGSSVMTALAVLVPRLLLRFGMEMRWVHRWGALLVLFAGVNLAVTLYFQASVDAQRNAYASGVLVLISCACVVTYLEKRRHREILGGIGRWLAQWFFAGVAVVFGVITLAVAVRAGSGLFIAALFILTILALSVISRAVRADELRTLGFDFQNDEAKFLWDSLRLADFPVLVPHRPGKHERDLKEQQIRANHQLDPEADVVFLEIHTGDPSDFFQRPVVEVLREDKRFVIRLTRCVSVAHAIAAVALEMSRSSKPPGLHFGWPEMDLLTSSWSYFAFGEGNIPWKVHELINLAEPDPAKRPRVVVG
jgi:hypothetical protein